ncbi:MAG: nucleoside hydrolase, partial [Alphaproteobacteria bacterium]|nr:nucleoside hydrolase [Alphaproteobacteria bacterium]
AGPRSRNIYINDLAGDIDGLFATVHMLLSHTSELRGIVGSGAMGVAGNDEGVVKAAALGREMVEMCGLTGKVPVYEGVPQPLKSKDPVRAPGVQALIDEAMREDTKLPLFVAVGGGLTEVASAVMLEPRITSRMKLIWIGCDDYPAGATGESNFNWDRGAAQYLYNETDLPIWQVPRSVYSQCAVSATELEAYVAPHGRIGAWLYDKVVKFPAKFQNKFNTGEMWCLGDSPLALLTALTDWVPSAYKNGLVFERTDSSHHDEVICPHLNPDGTFTPRSDGRKIRIYKSINTRMMFGDFFAKLALNFPDRAT